MKKLHVSELSDAEITAVFSTAVEEAVARARAAGKQIPTLKYFKENSQPKSDFQTIPSKSTASFSGLYKKDSNLTPKNVPSFAVSGGDFLPPTAAQSRKSNKKIPA